MSSPVRLVRRLAREHLPHRVRAAGLELLARTARKALPATPAQPSVPDGAALIAALRAGTPFDDAMVLETTALLRANRPDVAVSIAAGLQAAPGTRTIGDLVAGMVAASRGYSGLAWSLLSALPTDLWSRFAPGAFLRSGIEQDAPEALRAISALAEEAPDWVPLQSWLDLIGPAFAAGDQPLAARLFAILDRRVDADPTTPATLVVNRDWLRGWVHRTGDGRTAAPVPEGRVGFAVMDYGHPGRSRASANIGDHVQSLASFGHLVRHQNLRFHGPQDLVDLAAELQHRVRPAMQRSELDADVQLLQIDRDASMYAEIPETTWTLAFGWFMHAIFDMTFGFPFHPNLRPIFVSFHCSKRGLLTPESIDYLKRYEPIGCRDWTTVDVMLSVGVEAFFSGCMTTTVNTVFPDTLERPGSDAPVAYVDIPPANVPDGAPTFRHSDDAIRFRTFTANVYNAIDLLQTYRQGYSGLVTSRLHCYLPMRSLGTAIDFRPSNRSDPRFAGLAPITDDEFDAMRDRINTRLEPVLTAVFGGAPEAEVYKLWRDLNAADVAAAHARRERQASMSAPRSTLAADVGRRAGTQLTDPWSDDAIHVAAQIPAAGLDADDKAPVVLLRSLVAAASRPVHVWAVSRAAEPPAPAQLRAAVPEATFGIVSTHHLGQDLRRGDGKSATVTDIDLLSLAALLPQVDRLVVLPTAAVVLDDVAELADLDLGGALLAAPTVIASHSRSGFGLIHLAGNRLRDKTGPAAELRRQAHARHRFDFDAFDIDVLVLDTARLRATGLLASAVPYVEEFGLTGRELLHFLVGADRAVVPVRWHVVPTRSVAADAALLHWPGPVKPWSADAAPLQEVWHTARAGL